MYCNNFLDNVLYNVNKNTVAPCLEASYIKFVKELDDYLLKTYPNYYLGLQLYENKTFPNMFNVVAAHNNIPGIYEIAPIISNFIGNLYDSVWGDSVERVSVFSFLTSCRVYP